MSEGENHMRQGAEVAVTPPLPKRRWLLKFGDGETATAENVRLIAGQPLHPECAFGDGSGS